MLLHFQYQNNLHFIFFQARVYLNLDLMSVRLGWFESNCVLCKGYKAKILFLY